MKATKRKQIDKNQVSPAFNITEQIEEYIDLDNIEVECVQPDILDNEFYNTIFKHNNNTFMCNSIDLDFINDEIQKNKNIYWLELTNEFQWGIVNVFVFKSSKQIHKLNKKEIAEKLGFDYDTEAGDIIEISLHEIQNIDEL